MEIKVAGLIVGLLVVIGGVFMISFTEEVAEQGEEDPEHGLAYEEEEEIKEERPYFWSGVLVVITGLTVTAVSYIKEEY